MAKLASALVVLVVCTLVLFVVQNLGSVEINFLGWTMEGSLAVPVLAGYVFGGLTARPIWRLVRGQRKARKTKEQAEKAAMKKLKEATTSEAASKDA
jgi:uncharacterized integral membrane protein